MSAATNSTSLHSATDWAWTDFARDIRDGALATARLVVTFAGCTTLLVAMILFANDEVRGALKSVLPQPATQVTRTEEPAAPVEAEAPAASAPAASDPRQKHIVQYLARRYRVAEEASRMLVSAAHQIGREYKLDPLLILSVVAIESSLNPYAESAMGAQGLMQVMTRIHAGRFQAHGGQMAALDPVANMKVGSAILSDLIARGGSVERGLQLYVGAGNQADDGGYALLPNESVGELVGATVRTASTTCRVCGLEPICTARPPPSPSCRRSAATSRCRTRVSSTRRTTRTMSS